MEDYETIYETVVTGGVIKVAPRKGMEERKERKEKKERIILQSNGNGGFYYKEL